jgi:hypothetical protein
MAQLTLIAGLLYAFLAGLLAFCIHQKLTTLRGFTR